MPRLQIVENCDGCGACCRQTPVPPFEPGEEVQRSVPEQLMRPVRERIQAGLEFELIPCVWFDVETELCQQYDHRPAACRRFEVNSFECHAARNAELFP